MFGDNCMATTQVDLLAATERSFRNAMPCTFSVLVHICITCVQWLLHSTDRLALAALPAHAVLLQRTHTNVHMQGASTTHKPQFCSPVMLCVQLQQMYCWSQDTTTCWIRYTTHATQIPLCCTCSPPPWSFRCSILLGLCYYVRSAQT